MRNIVFDLDDTLWHLNKRASELTGIDFNKLKTFVTRENPLLTEEEKTILLDIYANPILWEKMEWIDGAKSIYSFEQLADDIKVYIVSNCMNQQVADYKRSFLSKELGIPDNQIILNVSMGAKKKKMIDNVYIFIDDSPYNITDSKAKYTFIPNKPWNQNVENSNTKLYRVDDFNDILNMIRSIILEEGIYN